MSVATITHGDRVFRFRTDPNSIKWNFTINTKVEETYAGRVVQVLSVKIENLTVTADSGNGGWAYNYEVATFFRDLLVNQRGGAPAEFRYPTRNYQLKVYATAMPFKDSWDNVLRDFTMTFKVQEDMTGVMTSESLSKELKTIQEGIGFTKNPYNYQAGPGDSDVGSDGQGAGQEGMLIPIPTTPAPNRPPTQLPPS